MTEETNKDEARTQAQIQRIAKKLSGLEDISDAVTLKDVDKKLDAILTRRDPMYITQKVEGCYSVMRKLEQKYNEILIKLNSYALEDKYAELFTDDEIKEFYMQSGLTQQQVKEFIVKRILDKEDITMQAVSLYCTGQIKDLLVRSKIGKYFRREMLAKMGKVAE